MVFQKIFIISILLWNGFASAGKFDRLCSRIYFEHPTDISFPFINILEGVYIKTTSLINNVPVYRNERGDIYFVYSRNSKIFYFTKYTRYNSIGLSAHANTRIVDSVDSWMSRVDNKTNVFGSAISSFYYRRNGKTVSVKISPRCVNFADCGSNGVIFTMNITGTNNVISNDPRVHRFNQLYNTFRYDRPVYKHSNPNETMYLFHQNGYWIVGNNYEKPNGFLSVRSSALKPYFILRPWRNYNGSMWIDVRGDIQCAGSRDTPCSRLYCRNGGKCRTNSFNASYCVCPYGYYSKCALKSVMQCGAIRNGAVTVNYEMGAVTTAYCPKYSPTVVQRMLCENYNNRGLQWYGVSCADPVYPTTTTTTTTTPKPTAKPLNLDENESASITIKVLVILIPILLPFIHYCFYNISRSRKGKDVSDPCRMCSLHAFIAFYVWIIFLVLYFACNLPTYGYSTMNFVFITALVFVFFNYFFMLMETRLSSEHEYLFSKLENDDTAAFINTLCETPPTIVTTMECYHMETKTRQVTWTDANGNTQYRTETYMEKVTTWIGSESFDFNHWKDTSDMSKIPVCDSKTVLKVKLSKTIEFADEETSSAFNQQLMKFVDRNKHRDVYYNFDTNYDIPNFKERLLCFHKDYKIPFWMNGGCLWFASVMCCTWPFRLLLKRSSTKDKFAISKLVSLNPFNSNDGYEQGDNQGFVREQQSPSAPPVSFSYGNSSEPPPSYEVAVEMQKVDVL